MSDYATNRMKSVIERLFKDAPKLEDASGKPRTDQAPALECHVVLKCGQQLAGAMSTTPEGGLRVLAPNKTHTGHLVMVETFFDYDQVAAVAVVRQVSAEAAQPSPIIHTS